MNSHRWFLSCVGALFGSFSAPHAAKSDSAIQSAPASAVVASYTSGQITQAELEHVIAQKLPVQRKKIAEAGGREDLLETIIRYDLLAQEAERRGYANHPSVVTAVRRVASERMFIDLFTVDPSKIDAAEVARIYETRVLDFSRPAMRRASVVQLATEAEAKMLLAVAKRGDRDGFARLARDHSTDPRTQRQGGELGYFDAVGKDRDQPAGVAPALLAAAWQLKVGEISQPIAHDGVYSLLMVTGEMAPMKPAREAIDAQIRSELADAQQKRAVDDLYAQLKAAAKPEVHPELLDDIVMPPAQSLDIPQGFDAAPPDPRQSPHTIKPDGF
jgi:parvulin-like peptidyl-prolyl isomerase